MNDALRESTRARCKLWVEHDSALVFGSGRYMLLQAIEETGSINEAATRVRISYRAAWGKIKATEERWGVKLLDRHVGGKGGGGATLTDDAREMMERYAEFEKRARAAVDEQFQQVFLSE